jgi:glycosyltransferase involved in cell wall biosynthesis
MKEVGAKLIVVEQAFGARDFIVTERDNVMHVQVRTTDELWHKENMINVGINYLSQIDPDWQYVAWIDGDIRFQRDDIIAETAHQLQHYDIVQMFSQAVDMGPNQEVMKCVKSFAYMYHMNNYAPPDGTGKGGYYIADKNDYWHPGYAWAAKRRTIDKIGLLDRAVLGSGDHHMALCLIGQGARSIHKMVSPAYRQMVLDWQHQAEFAIQRNLGYVPGAITHYWHGEKKNRKYNERWEILTKNNFDPYKDLTKDSYGLYKLNMSHGIRSIRLRDQLRQYFRSRNEDSIDYNGY